MSETTPRPMRRRVLIGAGIAVVVAAIVAAAWTFRPTAPGSPARSPREMFAPEERAPEGVRVRVEVLNATSTPRLALSATRLLRDRGFDVVSIGNSPARRDSTLVIDRTNHPEWARLVASVLGRAAVEARADTSRYVDVSVLIGANWTPPPKTLYP